VVPIDNQSQMLIDCLRGLERGKCRWPGDESHILTINLTGRGSIGQAYLSWGIVLTYQYQSVPRSHRHPHVCSPWIAGGLVSGCGTEVSKVLGETVVRKVRIVTYHCER